MAAYIITNKALLKMSDYGLTESKVLDTFRSGNIEKWTNAKGFNSVKKYQGYEIGVAYFVDSKGTSKITSVWKRERR